MLPFQFQPGFRQVDGSALNAAFAAVASGTLPGQNFFVDTVNGSSASRPGQGLSWNSAYKYMEQALEAVTDNSRIYFIGKVREQLVAPLGIQGVSIIGAAGGNVRDDDGSKWYTPASPVAGKALIEIREQGWGFYNFLMTPDNTGGACIKAHRNEDATYPDSSHFIVDGMRFVGAGGTPIGIQDVGGNHHYIVRNSEFQTLTFAITCTSTSIAVPLRNSFIGNKFLANTNDIATSLSYSLISGNWFFTAGSGATNKVISTTYNAVQGGNNNITWNVFNNTEAQIAPGSGFTGAASDNWTGNLVNNQAAFAFGQPA